MGHGRAAAQADPPPGSLDRGQGEAGKKGKGGRVMNRLAQGPEERKRLYPELVIESGEFGSVAFLRALTGLMRSSL